MLPPGSPGPRPLPWLNFFYDGNQSSGDSIMDSGKIVAIITGAISIALALAYLVLVQILDFRGEMLPAPMDDLSGLGFPWGLG